MKIEVQSGAPLEFATPCLVLPVFQGAPLEGSALELNGKLNGLLEEIATRDGFKGASGDTRVLHTNGNAANRVVLLGLGARDKVSTQTLRRAAAKAARAVRALKRDSFAFVAPSIEGIAPEEIGVALVEGVLLGLHVFNDFKTDAESREQTIVNAFTLLATGDRDDVERGAQIGQIGAEANLRARYWVNLPSNKKSPQFLAEQAQQIAQVNGLRCEIWDENRIQFERMDALHGVGMGSDNPPRFIILEYAPHGHEAEAPLVLVGKGMTFDTGGYSIKPASGMEDMKDDMGGAAVVLGAMSAIAQIKPQRRVLALIASAENMINGHALRPGDILTARNGKTIEVLNTDAEGRLILADALSYACEQNPSAIIDFATLTGAIGIALGQEAAGLFSNDDALAARVTEAGERSGDRVWRFPLWDEYKDHVKGTVSDVKNIGIERRAGSIAAAVFLQHFVGDEVPWAHLDIASVAFIREDRPLCARGATGFGVRLVMDLLRD